MKLIEFINLGGPLNWVLAAILCFCFCQCLERSIYFFQTRKGSKNDVLKRLQAKAATGLWLLNVISAVSPSIGLLGTVTGLIGSFSKMAEVGAAVNIQDLSGGIWEAMLTTAFGMIISIPALLCYRMFKRIIEKRMMLIELYGEEYEEAARQKQGAQ